MNLKPVNPKSPAFNARCYRCGKLTQSKDLYADLDGAPFKAYYCRECTQIVRTAKND